MPYNLNIDVNFGTANANFQQLIENNNKLQATVDQLGNKIQEFGSKTTTSNAKGQKSITDYAGSYAKLTQDIAVNRAALLSELKALESLRAEQNKDVAAIDNRINKSKQLEALIRQQTSTLNQYNKVLGNTSVQSARATTSLNSLSRGFGSLSSVLGVSFGLYGAFRVLQSATSAVIDFDLAQKKLQSILAETNKGMKDIADSAISVGKNSIFGAKGVTELQIELAKMGFAKAEIIAMQGAIVNLATATQEELAPSAEVVANIIRSFQLTAKDATMVVDTMGKAFNDSALDLSNFREAIKYVAPIAKQANFTFAETVSLLEALSNAGIKGSLAGTGLTNIISRLGNENSKFVKTLGHTVEGFDGFLAALVELNNRGVDLTNIFQLVDRRAAATFSILLDGVTTVEQFKEKLENASGVMKEQAAVQLDSIAYRGRLVKESWKAMIIEIDKGSGVISSTSKAILTFASRLELWVGGIESGASRQIIALEKLEKRMKAMGLFKTFFETTVSKGDASAAIQQSTAGNKIGATALLENAMGMGAMAESLMSGEIAAKQAKIADDYVKLFMAQGKLAIDKQTKIENKDTALFNVYSNTLSQLTVNKQKYLKMGAVGIDAAEAEQMAIDKLATAYDELGKTYKSIDSKAVDEAGKNTAKDKLAQLKAELELRKKIAIDDVKLTDSAEDDKRSVIEETYFWDKYIAEKTITDKKQRDLTLIDIFKSYQVAIRELDLQGAKDFEANREKEQAALQDLYDNWVKFSNDANKEILDDNQKATEDVNKLMEDQLKNFEDNLKKIEELKKKHPLLASLIPTLTAGQLEGMSEEDIKKYQNSFEVWGDSIKTVESSIKSFADEWVSSMDRIVQARNTMVSEAEQALQTELQLAEQGFASNVTLRQQDLANAKLLRKQALDDQKKAQKVQLLMDSATQASSLAVSVAEYFKSTAKFGPVGVVLAIASIVTMLGMFAKFKALAKEQSAVQYETGGWVGGKRHSQGGTHIEAETGEFVVNRKSAAKHKLMIEAINSDDKISLNRMYINGLKNGVLTARVSLDDSEDLKAIRKALEKKGKEISYFGNYRIEKMGNVTTKILMN